MVNWKYTPLLAALLLSAPTFAKGPGGGTSPGVSVGAHSATNTNGPSAVDRDTGSGRAEDVMSAQGKANANGPNSLDRDTGKARAADRTGAQAIANTKMNANMNGPKSLDRDKGLSRAGDRTSKAGAKRHKVAKAPVKRKVTKLSTN